MLQVQKAQELEVVELTKDLPQYGLSKGAQGTVLEVFNQPQEAYMIEFMDESGENSKIAEWVLPDQIDNVDLRGKPFFEKGLALLKAGKGVEAAEQLRLAVSLWPNYLRLLHNLLAANFEQHRDWEQFIAGMRYLIEIEPTYEIARRNLAAGFVNYGVKKANEGELGNALDLFTRAFGIEASQDFIELVRGNIAAAHVRLGIQSYENGDLENSMRHMQTAYMFMATTETRKNLALSYLNLADHYFSKKQYRIAITNYVLAEEAGLLTPEGLNNRAVAHLHLEQVDEAITALQVGLILDPNNKITRSNLSLLKANHQVPELVARLQTEHFESQFQTIPLTGTVSLSSVVPA